MLIIFILTFPHVHTIGCNARAVLQPDAVVPQWEATVDRFWQYIADLTQKADGVLQDVKSSQLSRELE